MEVGVIKETLDMREIERGCERERGRGRGRYIKEGLVGVELGARAKDQGQRRLKRKQIQRD